MRSCLDELCKFELKTFKLTINKLKAYAEYICNSVIN